MKQKITLVEFSIQLGNFDKNLSSGIEDIQSAASAGSRLVLLPELWTTGYTLEDGLSCAHNNQLALTELQSLSTNLNIIIGGTYLLEENGSIFNTFILLSPDEKAPTLYRKIHLFGPMEEDRHLTAGRQPVMVNSSIGKIGLSICYDLRFPELFRGYALQGAEIILLPAEWPVERISHWDTLIRARAIENQCFVCGANCTGPTGKEVFGGHSVVIDPWGNELPKIKSPDPHLLNFIIDTDIVARVREKMPVLKDRRPDLYQT